jgi:hypothetical protein
MKRWDEGGATARISIPTRPASAPDIHVVNTEYTARTNSVPPFRRGGTLARSSKAFFAASLRVKKQKPSLWVTTDKHPIYTKAIRWIIGRDDQHRHNQSLNNRREPWYMKNVHNVTV